jgi:hypothetical protein
MPIVLDGTTGITTPPIVLNSTVLGTAIAGELEYDGKVPYFTPQGLQRGVLPGMQYYVLDTAVVGSNSTTPQNPLGASVTVSSNTFYEFEGVFNFFKLTGSSNHTFSFGWGGTATLNRITTNIFVVNSINGYITLSGKILSYLTSEAAAQTVVTGNINTPFHTVNLQIRGIVSVNTGGTLTPLYQLSTAPGGAYTSSVSNYMKIWPIGQAGSNISVGEWA